MNSLEPSSETLPPGTTLGRYEIRRLIGQGGMGAVYEAVHRDLKKRVAVKTLLPALAANAEAKQRFFREGEAASRIRHPNVVDVTDLGEEGPVTYLVMEYLQGEDLAGLIKRQGALPIERTADILLPVVAAIASAHEQGVVHRDLKPENIFLAASEYGAPVPKVLDFGISKVLDAAHRAALTGTAVTLGTAYYLPPEHLRGSREADARGDQYALGAILYECVTGQRAFDGDSLYAVLKAVSDGAYAPPRALRPDLPAALETAIVRALQVTPGARFPSVQHLGATLLPFASPSARLMWQGVFAAAQPAAAAAIAAAPAVAPAVSTDALSPEEVAAALGRSPMRLRVLAGVAVVVVVGAVIAVMRHESKPDNPSATATAPAAPAPATPPAATVAAVKPAAPPAPAPPPPAMPDAAVAIAPAVTPAPVITPPTVAEPPPVRTRHARVDAPRTAPPAATKPAAAAKTAAPRPAAGVLPNNAPIVE